MLHLVKGGSGPLRLSGAITPRLVDRGYSNIVSLVSVTSGTTWEWLTRVCERLNCKDDVAFLGKSVFLALKSPP